MSTSLDKIPTANPRRRGSALIVALWVVLILSLMIGGFAFDMQIEAEIVSLARRRIKARYLAEAGVEWAKAVLVQRGQISETDAERIADADDNEFDMTALRLRRGLSVRGMEVPLGDGKVVVDMVPESSKRNVNMLSQEEWEELLDITNVPQELWPELIDCFYDWVDEDDLHRLHGAEQDDPYYRENNIRVKNAPVDTIDELLLIKNFDENIVYGGPGMHEDDPPFLGIAQHLTTWGDGRININTASREVLLTLTDLLDDFWVDAILDMRLGADGEPGTLDDGFRNVSEAIEMIPELERIQNRITTADISYVRVTSTGEVHGVRNTISCVIRVEDGNVMPVFWSQ